MWLKRKKQKKKKRRRRQENREIENGTELTEWAYQIWLLKLIQKINWVTTCQISVWVQATSFDVEVVETKQTKKEPKAQQKKTIKNRK